MSWRISEHPYPTIYYSRPVLVDSQTFGSDCYGRVEKYQDGVVHVGLESVDPEVEEEVRRDYEASGGQGEPEFVDVVALEYVRDAATGQELTRPVVLERRLAKQARQREYREKLERGEVKRPAFPELDKGLRTRGAS